MPQPKCHWCQEPIYGEVECYSPSGAYEFCSDECLFRWKVREWTEDDLLPSEGEALADGFLMMALAGDDDHEDS